MNEKSLQIANLARSKILGGKILSVQLSDKYNPHFAKILLRNFQNKRIAVLAELQPETAERLITGGLLWFEALEKLKTRAVERLWIISSQAVKLAKLRAALQAIWQQKIRIFDHQLNEVFEEPSATPKVRLAKPPEISETVRKIISTEPENIHVNGQFLTFRGLPFVRFNGQKNWFGIEPQKQLLTHGNWPQLTKLIENLRLYRVFDSPNRVHAFYKLFPEAWLESSLRNDISVLDAHLILSPLHQQFRALSGQIDLLALRKDGRLVIIELKVSPNREHFFQAVDYWQEIEKQRTAGNLLGLFGDLPIADQPSLIYLVAPHSSFHPGFKFLAGTVSDELEIYRFDLNENWRKKIKILEKQKIRPA